MLLKQVIRKYERISQGMPGTMEKIHAAAFKEYSSRLKEVAKKALDDIVTPDEADTAEAFIATFLAANAAQVMRFTLHEPASAEPGQVTAEDVERWVRRGAEIGSKDNLTGKVFDERDQDVESTVRKMQGILIYAGGNKIGAPQEQARSTYLPAIAAFMATNGVSIEQIEEWSRMILAAWVAYIRATWPGIARRYLRSALQKA